MDVPPRDGRDSRRSSNVRSGMLVALSSVLECGSLGGIGSSFGGAWIGVERWRLLQLVAGGGSVGSSQTVSRENGTLGADFVLDCQLFRGAFGVLVERADAGSTHARHSVVGGLRGDVVKNGPIGTR